MKHLICVATALALGFTFAVPSNVAAQEIASPGKNSAFLATDGVSRVTLPPDSTANYTVTILKGKPKRVLTLVASLDIYGSETSFFGNVQLTANANGVRMNGGDDTFWDYNHTWETNGVERKVVTATWWLDLDFAEAQNPGLFKGQPIDVNLEVGTLGGILSGPTLSVDTTMSARMEKK